MQNKKLSHESVRIGTNFLDTCACVADRCRHREFEEIEVRSQKSEVRIATKGQRHKDRREVRRQNTEVRTQEAESKGKTNSFEFLVLS